MEKKETLKLEHLAGYLPYGVKLMTFSSFRPSTIVSDYGLRNCSDYPIITYEDGITYGRTLTEVKPILRPLSDLFKYVDYNDGHGLVKLGNRNDVVIDDEGYYCNEIGADYAQSPTALIPIDYSNTWLYAYHFDIHGLIGRGLAIDINTF